MGRTTKRATLVCRQLREQEYNEQRNRDVVAHPGAVRTRRDHPTGERLSCIYLSYSVITLHKSRVVSALPARLRPTTNAIILTCKRYGRPTRALCLAIVPIFSDVNEDIFVSCVLRFRTDQSCRPSHLTLCRPWPFRSSSGQRYLGRWRC